MIDWFLLLAPLLLFPVVLLFAFVGCAAATLEGSSPLLTMSLLSSTHLPVPTDVYFFWVTPERTRDSYRVPEPEPDPVDVDGERYWEFRRVYNGAQEGPWTVGCSVYAGERNLGSNECPSFHQPAQGTVHVSFELVALEGADDEYEVVSNCP